MASEKEIEVGFDDKESERVRLAQNGDMKSFEYLVTLYEGYVYNLSYNMLGNKLDAQDVAQEIFLKIYKNINSFKFNSKFKTWVYRISINTCIDEYNKRKKSRIFEISDNDENDMGDFADTSSKTPEQLLEEKEIRHDIEEIIKKMPLKYKTIIILRDYQGLSYDEISTSLNLNVNTVKIRINRARNKIREKYNELENKRNKEKEKSLKLSKSNFKKGGSK